MTIIIDGRRCTTREATHAYLARKPIIPTHYGKNLDALHDVLTSLAEPTTIIVRYADEMNHNLGAYGQSLLRVLTDSAAENPLLTVEGMEI